jgi:hypothetical protein
MKRGRAPLAGPVQVALWFYVPDKRRRDWDNMAKAITDALNGHAYADDSQIARAYVDVALNHSNPRTLVIVEPLDDAGVRRPQEAAQTPHTATKAPPGHSRSPPRVLEPTKRLP